MTTVEIVAAILLRLPGWNELVATAVAEQIIVELVEQDRLV